MHFNPLFIVPELNLPRINVLHIRTPSSTSLLPITAPLPFLLSFCLMQLHFGCFHGPPTHSKLPRLKGISNPTSDLIPSALFLKYFHMSLGRLTLLKGNSRAAYFIFRHCSSLEPSSLLQIKMPLCN